jgi:hypothetical protein
MGMVRTDQMRYYARTVMVEHWGSKSPACERGVWDVVVEVKESSVQGWDFHLACGCKLQSCFAETDIETREVWHPEVAEWGKPARVIRLEWDAMCQPTGFLVCI